MERYTYSVTQFNSFVNVDELEKGIYIPLHYEYQNKTI